jgi:hypothetical protein
MLPAFAGCAIAAASIAAVSRLPRELVDTER